MGFLDYLFDSEYRQRSDINAVQDQAAWLGARQRQQQVELSQRIWQLENENVEIKQVCIALLNCLREQDLVTESVFAQQLEAVQKMAVNEAWRQVCPEIELPARRRRRKRQVDFSDAAKAAEEMTPYEE